MKRFIRILWHRLFPPRIVAQQVRRVVVTARRVVVTAGLSGVKYEPEHPDGEYA